MERGDQDLLDVGEEAGTVNGAIEDAGRGQASDAERREERTGLPPRARRVVVDACAARGAAVAPEQIGGDAGFVEKHQVRRVPAWGRGVPGGARAGDVRPVVLGRPHRFF